jgi:MFS transporter, FHS family, L-fucose permease
LNIFTYFVGLIKTNEKAMSNSTQTKWSQFGILVSVFFFWGFVAASNDILIPVFKEKLKLSQGQAQLVSVAFYVAYSVGALIYFIISKIIKQDLLNKIGFKNGISVGLIVSALGTLLFIPAADNESFNLFIIGLFIVGLGFSLQQTAANPLAISMGPSSTGAQRLSTAGGINNLGTTIGPLVVKLAIFGSALTGVVASLAEIKTPYLILGAAFVIVAIIFYFSNVPNKLQNQTDDIVLEAEGVGTIKNTDRGSAFNYPQLVLGMLGIFVYVGVEVSTAANLPEFMKQKLGTETAASAPYISLYWASLMIGRWTASAGAFGLSQKSASILKLIMPYLAFGVFLFANAFNTNLGPFWVYAAIIPVLIVANFLAKGNPAKELLIFSACGIIALLVGMLSPNPNISVYAFCSVGLFCSTLWPCIFTLATSGLGKHTSNGSNFLIFMIMGGGLVSWLQGYFSDHVTGISGSYIVGIACFAYLAFYAIRATQILNNQGINLDAQTKPTTAH